MKWCLHIGIFQFLIGSSIFVIASVKDYIENKSNMNAALIAANVLFVTGCLSFHCDACCFYQNEKVTSHDVIVPRLVQIEKRN